MQWCIHILHSRVNSAEILFISLDNSVFRRIYCIYMYIWHIQIHPSISPCMRAGMYVSVCVLVCNESSWCYLGGQNDIAINHQSETLKRFQLDRTVRIGLGWWTVCVCVRLDFLPVWRQQLIFTMCASGFSGRLIKACQCVQLNDNNNNNNETPTAKEQDDVDADDDNGD